MRENGGVLEGFSIVLGDGFLIFVGWRRGLLERERESERENQKKKKKKGFLI